MQILSWTGTHGSASAGGPTWTLRNKPELGFPFDTLSYAMGGGSKLLNNVPMQLTGNEVAVLEAWLAEQNPYQTGESLVHGIDVNGRYMGLVLADQAIATAPGAPPGGEGWRWIDGRWQQESTPELLQATLVAAVQRFMDSQAQAHGYDNINSVISYADEPAVPQFQHEGQVFRAWRSLVWAHCHGVMAMVMAEERQPPTAPELIAELPELKFE